MDKENIKTLSPSEALYGFCAWLSCREEITEFGSKKDCGIIPDLIELFVNENNLASPRECYHEILIHPKENNDG